MSQYVHVHRHITLVSTVHALVPTVINVEWVGLQYVSIISACSVAQCCGNSVKHHRGKYTVKYEHRTPVVALNI